MNNHDRIEILRRLCSAKNMVDKAVALLIDERETDVLIVIDTARDMLKAVRQTVKPDDRG